MAQDQKHSLPKRLTLECVQRAHNGAPLLIVLAAGMMYFIPEFPLKLLYEAMGALIILTYSLRFLYIKLGKNFDEHHLILLVTIPLSALFWTVMNALAIQHFNVLSTVGVYHLFLTNGLIAGVTYVLAPRPNIQKLYMAIVSLPIAILLLSPGPQQNYPVALIMGLGTLYFYFAGRGHSKDLRQGYENQAHLELEYAKLRAFFNATPGFIVMANEIGDWIQTNEFAWTLPKPVELRNEIDSFNASGNVSLSKEITLTGHRCDLHFIVSFLKDPNHRFTLVVGLPIDALKEAQEEAENQKASAEYAARLASVGEMAAGIAHEINNPLAVINLSSSQLGRKLDKAEIPKDLWSKNIDEITRTINRISTIVKSLQGLVRKEESAELVGVNLNEVIREVLNITHERMRLKGINVHYDPDEDLMIYGNHVELGQILINLINNAYDAIKGEGHIEISTQCNDKEVSLMLSDTGEGVPETKKNKIFLPFFTTKPVGHGTGLGLSICRSIVNKFGGEIEVLSFKAPTVFRIRFRRYFADESQLQH